MTAHAATSLDRPLCVDLDGTLIHADMLHESVFALLRTDPIAALRIPHWLRDGRAALKQEIAARVVIDAATLPYRDNLLAFIRAERLKGRRIVLVTASDVRFAHDIAEHLTCFDEVIASDGVTNLRASAKADALVARFGAGGFDYAGNSRDDLPVWDAANTAFVVGDEGPARAYAERKGTRRFGLNRGSRLAVWARTLRLHQWLKNGLLFVSLLLAGQVANAEAWVSAFAGFLAFGLCASSVYVLNDLLDLQSDRRHSTKRNRPLAAGLVSVPHALVAGGLCLGAAALIAAFLPPLFLLALAGYYVATLAYSFVLKRRMLIDVFTLAGLFTVRVIAGAAAIGAPVSAWLLAFSMFFFLSLALVKRFVELSSEPVAENGKVAGRGYMPGDIETLAQAGLASGFAAAVVLALFIDSPAMAEGYSHPELVWLLCPIVLYMVTRIWMLARRDQMHDDPVVFLMTDWRSLLLTAIGAAVLLAAKLA